MAGLKSFSSLVAVVPAAGVGKRMKANCPKQYLKIDGVTIYHNGDCKADYKNDFPYLKTKAEKIDIAFANTDAEVGAHYFNLCLSLINTFNVSHFFPMHCINKEAEYKVLGDMLTENGAKSENHAAKVQGDQFVIVK